MSARCYAARGRLLTALPGDEPRLVDDGLLVWDEAGRIRHAGEATSRYAQAELVAGDERTVIAAPFWDPHVHLPQLELAGRYREPLLIWLERRVFPAEARHEDEAVASRATTRFFDALASVGSVGAGIFTAPFPRAARMALGEARSRGVPVRCGAPLSDLPPPEGLPTRRAFLRALALARRDFGSAAAVVPRFALSCSDTLMEQLGAMARASDATVLSHVAENADEVAAVARRFPGESYAGVYQRFGLLGPRSLLAHGVHLRDSEFALLRQRKAWLVHCPSSNEALGSGRMRLERVREERVRWCLASDVGAGPELSMLHVIERFLAVHKGRAKASAAEGYARASLAGAEALGWGESRGALVPGRLADFVLVEGLSRRMRSVEGVVREWVELGRASKWRKGVDGMWCEGRRV